MMGNLFEIITHKQNYYQAIVIFPVPLATPNPSPKPSLILNATNFAFYEAILEDSLY